MDLLHDDQVIRRSDQYFKDPSRLPPVPIRNFKNPSLATEDSPERQSEAADGIYESREVLNRMEISKIDVS